MPVFSAFFLIAMLSSAGFPGLNGFVGEILCFFGVFAANKVLADVAVTTVILAAAYLLWMYQRVMHGPITNRDTRLRDMSGREIAVLVPIVVLMFWMGLFPGTFLRKMDASVSRTIDAIKNRPAAAMTRDRAARPAARSER